ncbi:hypothetical protein BOVMAS02_09020 [Streptococcus uberis]|uniref:EAL domain-containing protein n=1 Tax=Streptococcus uberis TaxID=1349 RepID=UPI0006202E43|nr:EAL domain-containing protein [Streptococcus uberis]KKF42536.1 cyclic diguanylate phosphodiesterase [Streptococcus uberis C9359]KKF44556.1 cyclic diguanylate phosphodiesterase [Streptococcus uberis Ab71]KKF46490.1 cyclic diguanylate phosphodiesterase [Streptococcus uberis C8329]KKF47636.1 cyclic diguanylate phosphodiesterase [Streptococcus uberis C5072]KKF50929.1 cyclic diguanylate phosphodiesterase [Streptococcus uberis S6261]
MLIEILLLIAIIFTIVSIVTILISYIGAKRQNAIYPKTMKNIENYSFHFQKIIDRDGRVSGFEALLRKYNEENKNWSLPEDIDHFTLREVIYLLHKSLLKKEYPNGFLAINISLKQLVDPRYVYFIKWLKGVIYPMKVRIEFHIASTQFISPWTSWRLKKNLKVSKDLGVEVILEQISPDKNYYQKVKKYLKLVSGLKIPLSKFQKKNDEEWYFKNIGDWVRLSQLNQISIDLTEIESTEDMSLADQLDMSNRQGYYIGKPLLKEN